MEIQLKKFDMNQIKDDKVVVLIGKRETGKSFLCKDLLHQHKDIPCGQVISATEAANGYYGKMVPPIFIHDEYKPEIIANVLKRQRMMIDKIKTQTNIDPRLFVVFDDCLYDNKWVKNKDVRSLFMNGRHWKILFMITMQYALGIPPNLRTNIDFVFILRENYVSNRKRLYEHYAGMFPTFEMFCQVMDQCTENYECLVIDNNAQSNRLEDQVFWYKATDRGEFKIGADDYWKYDREHRDENNMNNEGHEHNYKNRYVVDKKY